MTLILLRIILIIATYMVRGRLSLEPFQTHLLQFRCPVGQVLDAAIAIYLKVGRFYIPAQLPCVGAIIHSLNVHAVQDMMNDYRVFKSHSHQ